VHRAVIRLAGEDIAPRAARSATMPPRRISTRFPLSAPVPRPMAVLVAVFMLISIRTDGIPRRLPSIAHNIFI
jgi:hypothetical protein